MVPLLCTCCNHHAGERQCRAMPCVCWQSSEEDVACSAPKLANVKDVHCMYDDALKILFFQHDDLVYAICSTVMLLC